MSILKCGLVVVVVCVFVAVASEVAPNDRTNIPINTMINPNDNTNTHVGDDARSFGGHRQRNHKKRVMPWMCLERCGASSTEIRNNLEQIHELRDILSAVAFEMYNLGPNSTLVTNNLTNPIPAIKRAGLETWAMVSSYPYPPDFLDWMREVFAKPQPFIDRCIAEAQRHHLTGFNIDWEPNTEAKPQDSVDYANFLSTLTTELHKHNIGISVDVATWSAIWNYTALGESSTKKIITMSTYTGNDTLFTRGLEQALHSFGVARAGIGLQTENPNTNKPFPLSTMQWRFQQINARNVKEIDIWDSPIPQNWIPLLKQFAYSDDE